MSVFQQFFNKNIPQVNFTPLEPIPVRQPFPYQGNANETDSDQVALFISLTCRSCINIMENLPELLPSYTGGMLLFVLNGTAEELEEMKEYFGFEFPISSLSYKEAEAIYRIRTSPYAYGISQEGVVQTSGIVNTIEELQALITSMTPKTE